MNALFDLSGPACNFTVSFWRPKLSVKQVYAQGCEIGCWFARFIIDRRNGGNTGSPSVAAGPCRLTPSNGLCMGRQTDRCAGEESRLKAGLQPGSADPQSAESVR